MTKFTEREVRDAAENLYVAWNVEEISSMLTQLADMLAAAEKAEPVAWRTRGACMAETVYTEWMPDEPNVAAWEPLYTHPAAQPRVADVDAMVQRFLGWRLPENFSPDCGISFHPEYNIEYMAKLGKPPMRHEPTGTNLFDADQARAMIEHMLAAQEGRSRE